MEVAAVADERLFRDSRLRTYLRNSDLSLLGDWFVDGRLISPDVALRDGSDGALHRLYVLRVCAMLRARYSVSSIGGNEVLDYSVANREKPYFILGRYA
ncbi:hypothetical protein NDU88_003760 [Pleurodeles waltl]|uniref:Uncharacterized protein n=1 Tax=Pleurodeles waltl TaxID=8319 RepID=A0AAV7SGU4_PLEWA|nr:hypothetical protein NDU88_003760 [Pleurodeles waltl]